MTGVSAVRHCLAERGCAAAAAELFPDARSIVLDRAELRPQVPFEGRLFAVLSAWAGDHALGGTSSPAAAVPGDASEIAADENPEVTPSLPVVGLVVPGTWCGGPATPRVVAVADHVNLTLRGPLTGRWPAEVPRSFPCMTGVYQPGLVRPPALASLYSAGVIAAGVGDAAGLSAFEQRVLDENGYPVLSDCLVPVAIVAAYYRVNLAAGIVTAPP